MNATGVCDRSVVALPWSLECLHTLARADAARFSRLAQPQAIRAAPAGSQPDHEPGAFTHAHQAVLNRFWMYCSNFLHVGRKPP